MAVYVSLTSGHGEYQSELLCRHAETEAKVVSLKGRINCPNPLLVLELVFNLNNLVFPQPGPYWLEFRLEDVPLMLRRIHVEQITAPPGGGAQN